MENNTNIRPQQGIGLNLDAADHSKKAGQTTFVLNGQISNFDGREVVMQNEQANILRAQFPEGTRVIGRYNITQIERILVFLVGDTHAQDQIGYIDKGKPYQKLIGGECLGFNINFPIHQIIVKNTNCGIAVYWTDNNESMRHFSFEDLPWVEVPDPANDYKKIKLEGQLDCNKLLVQPIFDIPEVGVVSVEEGGKIVTGTYQFVTQYANGLGESYTSFYNVTNPISINQVDRTSPDFNLPTSKAIRVQVKGLDTSGVFDYFNLVVIETVNLISTPKLVGTYPITSDSYDILYTGDTGTAIQLTPEQIFQKFQYYDRAEGVTQTDDRIVWYGLSEPMKVSYQNIVSKVKLYWETYKIPYTKDEGYNNPMNTLLYKGYMRDEVYPVEICFLIRGGRQTDSFLTSGRLATAGDKSIVANDDARNSQGGKCDDIPLSKQRWQVYNTGTVLGTHPQYKKDDDCYKGPYQYGEFSYWESEEKYPNNQDIWGALSGTPIRHHKFPDELVSPRFSTDDQGNNFIYPIGIKIDADSLYQAIHTSNLSQEQKDDIIGFKVIRGDRSAGNMSVKAKGHFTNVGQYTHEEEEYLFPNYPYNSLYEDPLYATSKVNPGTGYSYNKAQRPYKDDGGRDRFTFHSPDTHFGRVDNVDTGYLKLESIDFGKGIGHFEKIKNNAEYKFITQNATQAVAALSAAVAFDLKKGKPLFNGSDFAQMYTNMNELFNKLVEFKNFGYNINSIAKFDQTVAVPNDKGNKLRTIQYGSYLVDGFNTVEEGKILNNKSRESSLYLKTSGKLLYAHDYSQFDKTIPRDDSRFIASNSREDKEDLTEEEAFQMFRTNYLYAGISVAMGIYASAQDLSGGDENLLKIVMEFMAKIFGDYIDDNDFHGLKSLEVVDDICPVDDENIPITPPKRTYTFLNSTTNLPEAYGKITHQTVSVENYSGEEWGTDLPARGWGIIPGEAALLRIPAPYTLYQVANTLQEIKSNEMITFNQYQRDIYLDMLQTNTVKSEAPATDTNSIPINWEQLKVDEPDVYSVAMGTFAIEKYGLIQTKVCGSVFLEAVYKAFDYAVRYYNSFNFDTLSDVNLKNKNRNFDVNAYYGSIKANLPAQWGKVYSYVTVDTGYYQELDGSTNFSTIFGGDTFINKFSFKTKLSVYDYGTVGKEDQSDLALDEFGTLGIPMFWISTKPLTSNFKFDENNLQISLSAIGATFKQRVNGNMAVTIGNVIMSIGGFVLTAFGGTGYGLIIGAVVVIVGALVNVIGSLFVNKSAPIEKASLVLFKQLIEQLINNLGIKNINLDLQRDIGILTHGIIYQYVYGIPTYFVESQVNVDYRQATNDNEGNFYPRVGEAIPDDWLQEDRVPIIHDNSYTYNKTFSKQNRENYYSHLKEDYDFNKECNTQFPNRAFWSEKANLEETLDNWLIYKPVSYYDFPKSYGTLTSLDGIKDRTVLARFYNKSQLYNTLTTINTSGFQAYLGNDQLFRSTPPLDLSETDTGSLGSQHKFLLKTPHGSIFTDSRRGQVILLQGNKTDILSNRGMKKWFDQHLKFAGDSIVDNNYNGVGIHGVYDEFYDRLIITKLDGPINSWTISFSFETNSWTSWHSYLPNYYVGNTDFFSSGVGNTLWDHNLDYTKWTTYYGTKQPYIVEYPFIYDAEDEVIQSIQDYTSALIYEDRDTYYEPNDIIYFNSGIIYNRNQTTGVLNLIPKPLLKLAEYMKYPKYNSQSKDILVDRKGGYYRFNTIRDIVKTTGKPVFLKSDQPTKTNLKLNLDNLQFGNRPFNSPLIRSKESRVRLILDNRNDIKLLSRVILEQNQTSKI